MSITSVLMRAGRGSVDEEGEKECGHEARDKAAAPAAGKGGSGSP